MEFKIIDRLPSRNISRKNATPHKNICSFLERFIDSGAKYAQVIYSPEEYTNVESANSSLCNTIKLQKYQVVVRRRNSKLYLVRKDI